MSRSAEIELEFAGEVRRFRLKLAQLERLQERCDERGPFVIFKALLGNTWKVRDVIEPIRLGLIGGGMSVADADRLIKDYVEDRPLAEHAVTATMIMHAVVIGPEIKTKGAKPGKTLAAKRGSTSPPSSGAPRSSGGLRGKSVN